MLLGARQFFERRGAPTPPLPYYAEVEYLESTGTQWIDTGIIPDANTGLQLFSASPVNTNDAYIAGERNDTSNTRWLIGWSASAKWYCGYGGTITSTVDGSPILTSINYLGDGLFKVGDSYSNTLPSLSYSPLYNIRLFGSAGVVAAYTSAAVKIYSAKISAGNILLRDFIPVRFTNELGQSEGAMYDRVSGQLFRNGGTGEFTIGPDKTSWTNPYVTDGLVAMWDGEWNAGGGVHDANATVWKDLVGTNDLDCRSNLVWGDSCAQITGDTAFGRDMYDVAGCSIEFVWQDSQQAFTGNYISIGAGAGIASPWYAHVGCGSASRTVESLGVGFSNGNNPAVNKQNIRSYSFVRSVIATNRMYWIDGVRYEHYYNYPGSQLSQITGVHMMSAVGTMKSYCTRIYSRALTSEELSANYAIDKARFNLP